MDGRNGEDRVREVRLDAAHKAVVGLPDVRKLDGMVGRKVARETDTHGARVALPSAGYLHERE